jgi:serine/threonine protein phosphatase PrpC
MGEFSVCRVSASSQIPGTVLVSRQRVSHRYNWKCNPARSYPLETGSIREIEKREDIDKLVRFKRNYSSGKGQYAECACTYDVQWEAFRSATRTTWRLTVRDYDAAALRYAVASNEGTNGSEFNMTAVYAGPHLLAIAGGIENMSSPGSASAIAVGELRRLDVLTDASTLTTSLECGIEGLRETLRELLAGDPRWEGTGTRLTAMLWRDTHTAIAHIGNMRAYMLRGGELTQLTRDHTYGQLLVEAGSIRPDEMGSDPRYSSVVVRWLDGKSGEPADITVHEAAIGDRYVLCTDGIDRVMSSGALRDVLRETARDPHAAADTIAGVAFPAEQYGSLTCIVADVVGAQR